MNKSDLSTYYNVGKLLYNAGKHYGEGIIKEYSKRLTSELGKGYSVTNLKYMRQFYLYQKSQPMADQLSWSYYQEMLPLKDISRINYYIQICQNQHLSKRKLKNNKNIELGELIPDPILIKSNGLDKNNIKEKTLQKVIVENINDFLEQLGDGFCYIKNEYPIKLDRFYYIDLLLFNIKYNCFVVVKLKVNELKKEDIGQITFYVNYIDKNIKNINQENTIGIILVKKDNKFVLEYSTDKRIYSRTYELI